MKLLKQDKPQCLLYAFAMVLDADPQWMMDYLEHDGLEVIWPFAPKPQCYRGFHHQEMIDLALWLGHSVVMIEALPCLGYQGRHHSIWPESLLQSRMDIYLKIHDGVLVSDTHAVAWNHREQKCYDPNGYIYGVDNFQIREFFMVGRGLYGEGTKERFQGAVQPGGSAPTTGSNSVGPTSDTTPRG